MVEVGSLGIGMGRPGTQVLVTGVGGFIGSHVAEALVLAGARVRGFLRYRAGDTRAALRWLPDGMLAHIELMEGDLRDPESVVDATAGCEVVLHLGAQVSVPRSYANVRDFFETNAMGTLNVALAACRADVRRLVLVSSSEVYGSARFTPIDENHPLQAQSPYAASKIAAEQLVRSLTCSQQLAATIVRPFNTFGPRQTSRAVIPSILSQAVRGPTVRLGSLWPRRDFTYVDDTVAGILALASAPEANGETVNLGTGQDVSIEELVELVAHVVGHDLNVEADDRRTRPSASEVSRLQSNAAKANALAGWSAAVPLVEGLRRTADWIGAHLDQYEPGRYVI
ncbi:SDR family NAD(P)-dependent oxidoreductase [Actinoplanes sp. NPDC051633]|uniref:SDR family NAD(P)-dependent oxidoreductase n=1 Tax=Actinoplanes sp. NPDC051633 TaxID=3155670 RepID=UPI003447A627